MKDISLANAVIAADVGISRRGKPQEVRVFPLGDRRADAFDLTWGACEACWRDHPWHRIGLLAERLLTLTQGFGVDPARIDSALQVVPEYRAWQAVGRLEG